MRLFMFSSVLGCCAAVVVAMVDPYSRTMLLFLYPILFGVLGAIAVAVFLLVRRPVTHVVLGDSLQTRPNKVNYQIVDLDKIEFVRDPNEDYDDSLIAPSNQAVHVQFRSNGKVRTLKLVLIPSDAIRLHEWATWNQICMTSYGNLQH